ncbi:phage terminase small subunit P27 family [Duganella sp.]|uniref:phage terminase small subunit P27 family n=1 Tax=Duganella sp. TaxID=1904440 RepID=UPI0031D36FE6
MAGNSNSGRKAIPATVHLIRGNPSKKSAEELAGATSRSGPPAQAPACPDFLTADAKTEWRRIINDLVVLGVVTKIDRAELAVYCQAWSDWKMARKKIAEMRDTGFVETTPSGYKQMSAWMQVANRAEDRMRTAGSSFGLNPAARGRLEIRSPQGELFPNEQKDAAEKYF